MECVRFPNDVEDGPTVKTNSTFLAALGLFVMLAPGPANAAPLTFCQENGHGANGCSDIFDSGGYCVENTNSTTGYVCVEDDPNANDGMLGNDDLLDAADPVVIRTVEGEDEAGTSVPNEPNLGEDSLF